MTRISKLLLFCCAVLLAGTLIYRSDIALEPVLPQDMPPDSRFIATEYDLEHNENKGLWVACHEAATVGESFCRVTDERGTVIFQGLYLPVKDARSSQSPAQTAPSSKGELHWVTGPVEQAPVPLIPMTDDSLLVPRADRDALIDRWNQHPEEWRKIAPTH